MLKIIFDFLSFRWGVIVSILFIIVYDAHGQDPLTKKLFMQMQYATISLPALAGDSNAAAETSDISVMIEDVTDSDSVNMDRFEDDIWKSLELNEVSVIGHRKQMKVSENAGKVNFSFVIKVPQTLIDDRWRVLLTPKVIVNDSIRVLESISLVGKEFKALQQKQYDEYDKFIKDLIVADKAFIDKSGVDKDIKHYQGRYFGIANKERNLFLAYEDWKLKWEQDRIKKNIDVRVRQNELYQELSRKALERRYAAYMKGVDTVGIVGYYEDLYSKQISRNKKYRMQEEMVISDVPKKYRDFFVNGTKLEDLKNYNVTSSDSLLFTSTNIKVKDLAENSYLQNSTEEIKKSMIRFPRDESVKMEFEGLSGSNFTYLYSAELPMQEGMSNFNLVLDARILAIDRSIWTNPRTDMLNYRVASLADYADWSFVPQVGDTLQYKKGLQALKERKYKDAMELLKGFYDVNVAITYACGGQAQEALFMLEGMKRSALGDYMKSILYARLQQYEAAVDFLLKVCNENPVYASKALSDSDVKDKLLPRFLGLDQELIRLQSIKN